MTCCLTSLAASGAIDAYAFISTYWTSQEIDKVERDINSGSISMQEADQKLDHISSKLNTNKELIILGQAVLVAGAGSAYFVSRPPQETPNGK